MHPQLERPEFWAAHYYLLLEDGERQPSELVEDVFGISNRDVESTTSTLS